MDELYGLSLVELLEEVYVTTKKQAGDVPWRWPDEFPAGVGISSVGIVSLHVNETAALHQRMAIINQILNAGWERS